MDLEAQPRGEIVPHSKTPSGKLPLHQCQGKFRYLPRDVAIHNGAAIVSDKAHSLTSRSNPLTASGGSPVPTFREQIVGQIKRYQDECNRLKLALDAALVQNENLQTNEAQYLGLATSSADHIFVLDFDGNYTYSNDKVRQFGLHLGSDLKGRRIQDVYHGDLLVLYRDRISDVLVNNKAVSFHHQKVTPGGEEYHIDTLYPIRYKGTLRAIGGICRNISEQKSIEKQLFQSQKMEALGTLVAGVAHEINNPINLILFNLPLLEKMWQDLMPVLESHILKAPQKKIGGLLPNFVKENLPRLISDMEMAANRVACIVSGLKGFSRKSNPAEKWDLEVNKAVQNAVQLAGATIKKSRTAMHMDLAPDMPLLHANLQNLEQVVLNLIINALENDLFKVLQVVLKSIDNQIENDL